MGFFAHAQTVDARPLFPPTRGLGTRLLSTVYLYSFNPDITYVKKCTRSSYLSDSGILAGNVRSGNLSTNVARHSPATNPGHTLDEVIVALAWISGS